MRTNLSGGIGLVVIAVGISACAGERSANDARNVGELSVALTNTPADVSCVRVTVAGARTESKRFSVSRGQNAVFALKGLPVGNASVSADAFNLACDKLSAGLEPNWYSEAVAVKISAGSMSHVALAMIHNGKLSVGIDFDERNGPSASPDPLLTGGTFSSRPSYIVPVAEGVKVKPLLTVGDSPNLEPDGVTPYRLVGILDGLGAYDNGDDTFTLLAHHELTATAGVVRAHGAKGAFVSQWTIRKADLAMLQGRDLIEQVSVWNAATSSYDPPAGGVAFNRFCSADLAAAPALYDVASGLGYEGRLFLGGEEAGTEGRAFVHALDGKSYEAPRMGKMSFENVIANFGSGSETIVAGMDDSGGGQVYFYVGSKTASGSPVERVGLTNGTLYGLKAAAAVEDTATGIADGRFSLFDLGNVENESGATLEVESVAGGVTKFNRPEDGAWDPNHPSDFYFVTTGSFTTASRLWRVSFDDLTRPELGGTMEMLLEGSEGQKMLDNLTIDRFGHIYMQEDPGNQDHLAKVWRYDLATGGLEIVAQFDPNYFDPTIASPTFITKDEESSGIIDAFDVLGPGWFLLDAQAHSAHSDPELVEPGQLIALYDPAAAL